MSIDALDYNNCCSNATGLMDNKNDKYHNFTNPLTQVSTTAKIIKYSIIGGGVLIGLILIKNLLK